VVHTYSGYENKVKTDLERRIAALDTRNEIVDIKIPTEEVTEIKDGGKRETKEAKVFPGYVLVRMEAEGGVVDDNLWQIVRNTPGVTGFVGIDGKPTPLRREEFNKIMRRSNPRGGAPVAKHTTTSLEPGMAVRVISGPLADFDGQVSEVNAESGKVKVMLTIFGRDTPVELTLDQVTVIA
jgi:transcriptional antiterminator NusG